MLWVVPAGKFFLAAVSLKLHRLGRNDENYAPVDVILLVSHAMINLAITALSA